MPNKAIIFNRLLESFPFEKPRVEQVLAFEHLTPWLERLFIQNFENPLFFGCDAPAGIGKSLIAISTALAVKSFKENKETDQIWIVTQNKILQDQYLKDFGDKIFDLRGLDNYSCYEDRGKSCAQSGCGRIKSKAKGSKPLDCCSFSCEYDEVSKAAKKAPVLSLNVAKALTMLKNPKQPKPLMMIFDEGHEVESALDNESTISITPDYLQSLGLIFSRYFQDLTDMEEIKKGLTMLVKDCKPLKDAEEASLATLRDVSRFKRLDSIITKSLDVLDYMSQGIDYVSCALDKIELKPLKVHKVFEKTFNFPVLFLSATLLSKKGFQSITGLKNEQLEWFSCDSPFPVENRPLRAYWRMGSTAFNYQNQEQEMPNLIGRIREILLKHPNERGIIHTHTYKNAEKIMAELFVEFKDRLIFPKNSKEQKDALLMHSKKSNSVLISPSMTQGVDLKEDLCRFAIMCKVPWLPTNDPVVKARMQMDPDWYTYKTAMTVVQTPGRGVRSEKDTAETYLIDPGFIRFFNMASHLLPEWFLKSVHKKPCGKL